MKGGSLLTVSDLEKGELEAVLDLAGDLKAAGGGGEDRPLKGRVAGLLFEKPSTRTRLSFEVAIIHLGGAPLYLSSRDLQIGRGETIPDTARVLSRYLDIIVARTFAHETLEDLVRHGTIPVINGLSDRFHPCQALADLLTIREVAGELPGTSLAYLGDGNNVCHSLLLAGARAGLEIRIATPQGYAPAREVVEEARKEAALTGGSVRIDGTPREAVEGVRFVYTDVWTSMGQEEERAKRLQAFAGYQVDEKLLAGASPEVRVMHCLPAHRGEEISQEVLDGPRAIVWDQAENRLHAQKGLLVHLARQGWGSGSP